MSIEPPERAGHPRNPWWWSVSLLGAWPVKLPGRVAEPIKPDDTAAAPQKTETTLTDSK